MGEAAEGTSAANPDARFLLANERTYLAYLRTSLALLVAGAALVNSGLVLGDPARAQALGVVCLVIGASLTGAGYARWRSNDRRIRADQPLQSTRLPLVLAVVVIGLGATSLALALL